MWAEAQARTAVEQAEARAEAVAAAAAARAEGLCAEIERRVRSTLAGTAHGFPARVVQPASPPVSPGASTDAVRRQAYFKAERRGFMPGHETEDWLEAERELRAAAVTPVGAGMPMSWSKT